MILSCSHGVPYMCRLFVGIWSEPRQWGAWGGSSHTFVLAYTHSHIPKDSIHEKNRCWAFMFSWIPFLQHATRALWQCLLLPVKYSFSLVHLPCLRHPYHEKPRAQKQPKGRLLTTMSYEAGAWGITLILAIRVDFQIQSYTLSELSFVFR